MALYRLPMYRSDILHPYDECCGNSPFLESRAQKNIFVLCFGLNDPHELKTHKKRIACIALLSNGGICRPLSNGNVMSFCRDSTFGIKQLARISLPPGLTQLRINQAAGLRLGLFLLIRML